MARFLPHCGKGQKSTKGPRCVKFIIAIIKPFKLDEVREALGSIGSAGMTIDIAEHCERAYN